VDSVPGNKQGRDRSACPDHGLPLPCNWCEFGSDWRPWFYDLCSVSGLSWPASRQVQRESLGIPCACLLVTDHRAALPAHVCYEVMRATTNEWVRRHFANFGAGESYDLWSQDTWPLPVSAEAILTWHRREVFRVYGAGEIDDGGLRRLSQAIIPQQGFGFDWLGLVIERSASDWAVTLFAPVDRIQPGAAEIAAARSDDPDLQQVPTDILRERFTTYRLARPSIMVAGQRSTGPHAQAMARKLSRWYERTLLGLTIGGRPEEPLDLDAVIAICRAYRLEHGGRLIAHDELRSRLCRDLGRCVETRQYYDLMQSLRATHGLTWRQIQRS
jgi:hypothetical protein